MFSMANPILDLIFGTLLRLDPSLISKYSSSVQNQIMNLFLIPHVILFLFIYGFAWVIIPTHKGLKYLISILAYLTVVLLGEPYSYYSMIVPFFLLWWQVALVVGLFFFIWSRFINPSKTPELFNLGRAATAKMSEGSKRRRALLEEIDATRRQIAALRMEAANPGLEPSARSYIQSNISNLEAKRRDLEARL
jgi:hypothetical protein